MVVSQVQITRFPALDNSVSVDPDPTKQRLVFGRLKLFEDLFRRIFARVGKGGLW